MKRKLKKIIKYIFIIICLFILILSIYINYKFKDVTLEQLIYSIFTSEGTSFDAIIEGLIFVIFGIIFMLSIITIINKVISKINSNIYICLKMKNKCIKLNGVNLIKNLFLISISVFFVIFSIKLLSLDEYIKNQMSDTKLFDDYYVNSKNVELTFPDNKRNLIHIYVESLEMTNASIDNGGGLEKTYIPNLEKLAMENINFSNTDKLGGALAVNGTTWTAAALIAHTSGVPLKVSISGNEYSGYSGSLPGVYSLGEILGVEGYKNYFLMGSKAEFGGRKDYFTYHGNYEIYDYHYAVKKKLIDEDYYVWWGYEDSKLYKCAKEKLVNIAKESEPFNFTMLTADTHFVDGYLDPACNEPFDNAYANSFNCTDSMLIDFINWIKEQEFYDNTTIIITGDHLTMQEGFYTNISKDYNRNIYNVIINSKQKPIKEKNRLFSTFDIFPTTLGAIGVKIDGNRLGLGTNLFSDKKTLIEELGYDYFNNELKKKSFFYDNYLLGDTYYEMQKESN